MKGSPEDFEELAEDIFGETLRRASLKRKKYMKEWNTLEAKIKKDLDCF